MNFKEETLNALKGNSKTWEDVKFIQGSDFRVANSKDEILRLMDFEYDNGYGGQEIARDLVIVGDNWWLERHEYDGSEWWEYKELPKAHSESRFISKFTCSYSWQSLKQANERE